MALSHRLKRLLDEANVPHEVLPHREAFTAQEVAATSHVSGYQVAKVVTVREEGGGDLMAVLPAACRLDLPAFRQATGRRRLSLLREEEMKPLFPDCEVGAMPPFGHLYGLPVYVDACFPRAKDIVFQAGNHHEVVRMPYPEYERLARPVVVEICHHQREKTLGE